MKSFKDKKEAFENIQKQFTEHKTVLESTLSLLRTDQILARLLVSLRKRAGEHEKSPESKIDHFLNHLNHK